MSLNKLMTIPSIFRSVFTKLTLISLTTWILILVAVVATFLLSRHNTDGPFHKNLDYYFKYIADDIGNPPSKDKALILYKKTGVHTTYFGTHESWTTQVSLPDISAIEFHPLFENSTLEVGRKHGHHFGRMHTDRGTFIFEISRNFDDKDYGFSHLLLMVLLSVIIFVFYLAVKKVLNPLKRLDTGVREVARGNLSHRVPVHGHDELADLANGFNEMTSKLEEMITAKEHLLRNVSHELRSPLTRIRVALELSKDPHIRQEIEQDISEMETMITAILEAARANHTTIQATKERCDLNLLVASIVSSYRNMVPEVICSLCIEPIYCNADTGSLKTVITNLLDNALKFSEQESDAIRVHTVKETECAIITIIDHGTGIPEQELPFIFDPFYRVNRSRSNRMACYGLGLNLCKAIIEAHGGRIEVFSKVDSGTEMRIHLPYEKE